MDFAAAGARKRKRREGVVILQHHDGLLFERSGPQVPNDPSPLPQALV
jgi:hypothetical protein